MSYDAAMLMQLDSMIGARAFQGNREAEVANLAIQPIVQYNVQGLEISVNHIEIMQVSETLCNLCSIVRP